MANKRISEYPAATTPVTQASDLALISQSGSYKKITIANLLGEYVGQATGTLADRAVPVMDGATSTDIVTTGVKIDATTNAMYGAQQLVVDKTSDYPIVLATDKGKLFTNDGASATVNFTLPASATEGTWFNFAVREAYSLKVTAPSGETLVYGDQASASSGYVASSIPGSLLAVTYVDGAWHCEKTGKWSFDGTTTLSAVSLLIKAKGSTEGRSSTTTLADDSDLTFSVVAGVTYRVIAYLDVQIVSSAGQGIKVTFNGTATGTIAASANQYWTTAPITFTNGGRINTLGQSQGGGSAATEFLRVVAEGAFVCTGSGTFNLQWAQYSSSGNATNVLVGSHMMLVGAP